MKLYSKGKEEDRLYTANDLAVIAKVSLNTLRQRIKYHKIVADGKIDGRNLYSRKKVEKVVPFS